MSQKSHWESVYATQQPERLGWYKPRLSTSCDWIRELGLEPDAPIIDIGTGASTFVDELLDESFTDLTGVELSENALAIARSRLGAGAEQVTWRREDITAADLPSENYALRHDRAVFHFLTEPQRQEQYMHRLIRSLCPGGT